MSRGSSRIARVSAAVREELVRNGSISRAFEITGFPSADAAVIEAGEATGRLEQIYGELEQYYSQLADARHGVIKRSIYPLVILHLAAVLLSIAPALLDGGWETFWRGVFAILIKFYAVAIVVTVLAWAAKKAFTRSAIIAQFLSLIPLVGGFLTSWSAWKFSLVFSMYVRSGGGMLRGLGVAGDCSESAILRSASHRAVGRVQGGVGLAEAMRASRLPETLERAIEVGEVSGRLDEEIHRASELFRTRFFSRLDTIGVWLSWMVYFFIVLIVGYQIIQNFLGVRESIFQMIDGEL